MSSEGVVYLSFLDIQPNPPEGCRLKFTSEGGLSFSLPFPGPHKPRQGIVFPDHAVVWPLTAFIDGRTGGGAVLETNSAARAVVAPNADGIFQELVLELDNDASRVQYSMRILLTVSPTAPPPVWGDAGGTEMERAIAFANSPEALGVIDDVNRLKSVDINAFALTSLMSPGRAVLLLSTLALAETGPGRVKTTSECQDLLYALSPLSAFIRALLRTYLWNDMMEFVRPLLAELSALCDDSGAALSTKSLVDQTIIASLSVRLSTTAVEIVTTKLPIPFVVALEEACRLNLGEIPTPALVGAVFCANLVTASLLFADQHWQATTSPQAMAVLVKVHTVVIQALIASVDSDSAWAISPDLATLAQGLGADIRVKAESAFTSMVAKCHTTQPLVVPPIEKEIDSASLAHATAVVLALISPPSQPAPEATVDSEDKKPDGARKAFLTLLDDFKTRAFRNGKEGIHALHQYHLHKNARGTHFNAPGLNAPEGAQI